MLFILLLVSSLENTGILVVVNLLAWYLIKCSVKFCKKTVLRVLHDKSSAKSRYGTLGINGAILTQIPTLLSLIKCKSLQDKTSMQTTISKAKKDLLT